MNFKCFVFICLLVFVQVNIVFGRARRLPDGGRPGPDCIITNSPNTPGSIVQKCTVRIVSKTFKPFFFFNVGLPKCSLVCVCTSPFQVRMTCTSLVKLDSAHLYCFCFKHFFWIRLKFFYVPKTFFLFYFYLFSRTFSDTS